MAPIVRDSTSGVVTSQATANATTPLVADGDRLLIFAWGRVPTSGDPAGFDPVLMASSGGTASHVYLTVWDRLVADAVAEPGSHTVNWTANAFGGWAAVTVGGADPTAPIDAAMALPDLDENATVASPSVDTTVDDCLLLRLAGMNRSGGLAAGAWAPADATKLQDPGNSGTGNRVACAVGWENAGPAGSTGPETWTVTAASFGLALGATVALAPTDVNLANAGPDQTVDPGELVLLDGTGSAPEVVSWAWTQIAGVPDVTAYMAGADSAEASFFAPQGPTVLTFQLAVSDGVDNDTDTVDITINPASAGPIRRVRQGGTWV